MFSRIFPLLVLILSVLTAINTIYGVFKSGFEYTCFYSRPGFLISSSITNSSVYRVNYNGTAFNQFISRYNGESCYIDYKNIKMNNTVKLLNESYTYGTQQTFLSYRDIYKIEITQGNVIKMIKFYAGDVGLNNFYPTSIDFNEERNLRAGSYQGEEIKIDNENCTIFQNIEYYNNVCDMPDKEKSKWFIFFMFALATTILVIVLSQFRFFMLLRAFTRFLFDFLGLEYKGLLEFCDEKTGSFLSVKKGGKYLMLSNNCAINRSPQINFKSKIYWCKEHTYFLTMEGLTKHSILDGKTTIIPRTLTKENYFNLVWFIEKSESEENLRVLIKRENSFHCVKFEDIFLGIVDNNQLFEEIENKNKKIFAFDPDYKKGLFSAKEWKVNFNLAKLNSLGLVNIKDETLRFVSYLHCRMFFPEVNTENCFNIIKSISEGKSKRPFYLKNSKWKFYLSDVLKISESYNGGINKINKLKTDMRKNSKIYDEILERKEEIEREANKNTQMTLKFSKETDFFILENEEKEETNYDSYFKPKKVQDFLIMSKEEESKEDETLGIEVSEGCDLINQELKPYPIIEFLIKSSLIKSIYFLIKSLDSKMEFYEILKRRLEDKLRKPKSNTSNIKNKNECELKFLQVTTNKPENWGKIRPLLINELKKIAVGEAFIEIINSPDEVINSSEFSKRDNKLGDKIHKDLKALFKKYSKGVRKYLKIGEDKKDEGTSSGVKEEKEEEEKEELPIFNFEFNKKGKSDLKNVYDKCKKRIDQSPENFLKTCYVKCLSPSLGTKRFRTKNSVIKYFSKENRTIRNFKKNQKNNKKDKGEKNNSDSESKKWESRDRTILSFNDPIIVINDLINLTTKMFLNEVNKNIFEEDMNKLKFINTESLILSNLVEKVEAVKELISLN